MAGRLYLIINNEAKLVYSNSLRSKKSLYIKKNMLNKSGPKIEPWGTPNNISTQLLRDKFILVFCFHLERYEKLLKIRLN